MEQFLVLLATSLGFVDLEVSTPQQDFAVNVSDSEEEREKGLMGVESLESDEGMLFVFENESKRSFWMYNTSVPLDIVFLDSDLKVLNVEAADPEPSVPREKLERYSSDDGAQYVLEIRQGLADSSGIKKGERLGLELRPGF